MHGTEAYEVIYGKRLIPIIPLIFLCVFCRKTHGSITGIPVPIPSEIFWMPSGFCILFISTMMCGYGIRNGTGKSFYRSKLPIKYIGWINYE